MSLLLDVAGLPRSTYYYYTKKQKEPEKYAELKEEICSIAAENKGRYGYRRVTQELRNRGLHYNHKLVMKLMKQLGLSSKVRMKKYRSYKGEVGKIAPNLLKRDFYAEKPNQKWVTDVTEFSLFGEKLYFLPFWICAARIWSAIRSRIDRRSEWLSLCWRKPLKRSPKALDLSCILIKAGSTSTSSTRGCWNQKVYVRA